jgi:hypothetical protein
MRLRKSSSRWSKLRRAVSFSRGACGARFEQLEQRTLFSTIVWGGADGNFDDPTKWVGGVAPGSADVAQIDTAGTYTVTVTGTSAVQAITVGGGTGMQTLALNSGAELDVAGTATIAGVTGELSMNAATVHATTLSNNGGTFALDFGSSIISDINNSGVLAVAGTDFATGNLANLSGGNLSLIGATLNVTGPVSNSGAINLLSPNSFDLSELTVVNANASPGTVTNLSGGNINATAGGIGTVQINAAIQNNGSAFITANSQMNLNLEADSSFAGFVSANAQINVNLSLGVTLTDTGTDLIAAGIPLVVFGGTFDEPAANSITGASGVLSLQATQANFTNGFDTSHATLEVVQGATFAGGTLTVSANPLVLDGTIISNVDNFGLIKAIGSESFQSEISGTFTSEAMSEIDIIATSSGDGVLIVPDGFRNNGILALTSDDVNDAILTAGLGDGTIINAGDIEAQVGMGGQRKIEGVLDNRGTLGVTSASMTITSTLTNEVGGSVSVDGTTPGPAMLTTGDIFNSGSISLFTDVLTSTVTVHSFGGLVNGGSISETEGDSTLIVTGGSSTGSISVGGTLTFDLGGARFDDTGSLMVNGLLAISDGTFTHFAENGARFGDSGGTIEVDATASAAIDGIFGGSVSNDGTLNVTGGFEAANFTQSSGAMLENDVHFNSDFIYSVDPFVIDSSATFDGTLVVDSLDGYSPSPGDSFDLVDYSSHIGNFATTTLPIASGTQPSLSYGASSLTLNQIGTTPPTVTFDSASVENSSGFDVGGIITIDYIGSNAIDTSTINGSEVKVLGPAGQLPVTVQNISVNGDDATVTYFAAAPNGTFHFADNGTYMIEVFANHVFDVAGLTAPDNGTIGSFVVAEPAPPTATLASTSDIVNQNQASTSFSVEYDGNDPIDTTTLGNGNVSVQFATGAPVSATFVGFSGSGNQIIATYSVAPPNGETAFTSGDNGPATITVNANQVFDVAGLPVNGPATVGQFTVNVLERGVDLKFAGGPLAGGTFAAGSVLAENFQVQNLGDTDSTSFNVQFILSPDDVFGDGNDIVIATDTITGVVSGSIANRQALLSLPELSGNFFLRAQIDPAGTIGDIDPTNNFSLTNGPTFTLIEPDLSVAQVTYAPATYLRGGTIAVSATIVNSSPASAGAFVTNFVLSTDMIVGNSDDVIVAAIQSSGIAGNLALTLSPTLNLPASMAPGAYFLIVQTDSNNMVAESNETNNVFTSSSANINVVAVDTPPTARLSVAPDVTSVGTTFYDFTVTYTDNIAVDVSTFGNGNIRVTGPNGFSQLAALLPGSAVTSGRTRSASYRITAPNGAFDAPNNGTYTISFVANQVADTAGNFAAASALGTFNTNTVSGTVDLVLGSVSYASGAFTAGSTLAITSSITTTGNLPANGFSEKYYLSSDSVLGNADDILIGSINIARIAAGGNRTATDIVQIPLTAPAAAYFIIGKADGGNVITETSEDNNVITSATANISVAALDLTHPASSALPLTVLGGPGYTFTLRFAAQLTADDLSTMRARVTGPKSFLQVATLQNVAFDSTLGTTTATYQITAPFNIWTGDQNGTYNIFFESNNSTAPTTPAAPASPFSNPVGSFQVAIPGSTRIRGEIAQGHDNDSYVDKAGKVHLAYYDPTDNALKYIVRNPSGTFALIETIDDAVNVGQGVKIVVDNRGIPSVAYYDAGNADLKFATRGAKGGWTSMTIDSAGDVGQNPSMTLDRDGKAAISYYDATNQALKLAQQGKGMNFTTTTLDNEGNAGMFSSIMVNPQDKRLFIAYTNSTDNTIEYADQDKQNRFTIDTIGPGVGAVSLIFGSDKQPAVSYYDPNKAYLKFAKFDSGAWHSIIASGVADVGKYNKLFFNNVTGKFNLFAYSNVSGTETVQEFDGGLTGFTGTTLYSGGGQFLSVSQQLGTSSVVYGIVGSFTAFDSLVFLTH